MTEIVLEFGPVVLSGIAVVVSILAWRKSRVIYEITHITDRDGGLKKVNELLKSEKFTILHVYSDPSNSFRTIYILGRIAKSD